MAVVDDLYCCTVFKMRCSYTRFYTDIFITFCITVFYNVIFDLYLKASHMKYVENFVFKSLKIPQGN